MEFRAEVSIEAGDETCGVDGIGYCRFLMNDGEGEGSVCTFFRDAHNYPLPLIEPETMRWPRRLDACRKFFRPVEIKTRVPA